MSVSALTLAITFAKLFQFEYGFNAGLMAGALTSTPSLNIVTSAAKSSIPVLGCAGTYTFANVFLTFAGTIIMML